MLVPVDGVNHAVLKDQMLRPVPSHAGGQGFKSPHLHQISLGIGEGWQQKVVSLSFLMFVV
jgi:hypothetical protein